MKRLAATLLVLSVTALPARTEAAGLRGFLRYLGIHHGPGIHACDGYDRWAPSLQYQYARPPSELRWDFAPPASVQRPSAIASPQRGLTTGARGGDLKDPQGAGVPAGYSVDRLLRPALWVAKPHQ